MIQPVVREDRESATDKRDRRVVVVVPSLSILFKPESNSGALSLPAGRWGSTYVVTDADGRVAGYYTLVAARVDLRRTTSDVRAVVVDAVDADAAAFYARFGFAALDDEPLTLMATVAMLRRAGGA